MEPEAQTTLLGDSANSLVEILAKSVAILAILIYVLGFLVTSIHYSIFGFIETSPLKPRILAAGVWLSLFVCIPAALVIGNRRIRLSSGSDWLKRPGTILMFYLIPSWLLGRFFHLIFESADQLMARGPSGFDLTWWDLAFPIGAAFLTIDELKRFPRIVGLVVSVGCCLAIAVESARGILAERSPTPATITLWFFFACLALHQEMRSRDWKVKPGNWLLSITLALGILLGFSTWFYPYISAPWGGGAPVPITIWLTKDSVVLPSSMVNAMLIDESDIGVYLIADGDRKATFIPRNAIGLIHYSNQERSSLEGPAKR